MFLSTNSTSLTLPLQKLKVRLLQWVGTISIQSMASPPSPLKDRLIGFLPDEGIFDYSNESVTNCEWGLGSAANDEHGHPNQHRFNDHKVQRGGQKCKVPAGISVWANSTSFARPTAHDGTSQGFYKDHVVSGTLRHRFGLISCVVLALSLYGFGLSMLQAQTTINVPGDYATIQAAVNAANAGDVIVVDAGTYNETVTIAKSNITLQGPNAAIPGNGTRLPEADVTGCFILNGTSNVTISGFSVNKTTSSQLRGILVGNAAANPGPVIITNNIISNWTTGISLAGGATLGWANNVTITGNLLVNNGIGSTENATNITIQNNTFNNGGIGLGGPATLAAPITGNNFTGTNNLRYISIASNVTLYNGQTVENILANNTFDKSVFLSEAAGQWYSRAIFNNISGAVSAAASGAIITVSAGTFSENITINKPLSLHGNQFGVKATGTTRPGGETIIDGTGGSSSIVITVEADNVTIDGFAINPRINPTDPTRFARDGINVKNTHVAKPGDPSIEAYRTGIYIRNNWIYSNIGTLTGQQQGILFGESPLNNNPSDPRNAEVETVVVSDNYINMVNTGATGGPRGFVLGNQFQGALAGGGNASIRYKDFTITGNTIYASNTPFFQSQTRTLLDDIEISDNVFGKARFGVSIAATMTNSTFNNNTISEISAGSGATLCLVNSSAEGNTFEKIGGSCLVIAGGRSSDLTFFAPSANATIASNVFKYNDVIYTGTAGYVAGLVIQPNSDGSGLSIANTTGADANSITLSGNTFTNMNFNSGLTSVAIYQRSLNKTLNAVGSPANVFNTLSLDGTTSDTDLFSIADLVADLVDAPNLGYVNLRANNVYVTTNSFWAPTTSTPSILRGYNAAAAGDILNVTAGEFNEPGFALAKAITIRGAQAGVDARTRGASETGETVLSGNGRIFDLNASNITLDGLYFRNLAHRGLDSYSNPNNFSVRNCVFNVISTNNQGGAIQFGGGANLTANNFVFEKNLVKGSTYGYLLYFLHSASDGLIQDNTLNSGSFMFGPFGQPDGWQIKNNLFDGEINGTPYEGYPINAQFGNAVVQGNTLRKLYAGMQLSIVGGSVTNNVFEDNARYGLELFGGAWNSAVSTNATISNNTFTYNGTGTNSRALRIGRTTGNANEGLDPAPGINGSTINITNNSFVDLGFTPDVKAIAFLGNNTLNATCNWWGAATTPSAKVSGNVNFTPWLTDGTDTDGTTLGFQPESGTCNGSPELNFEFNETSMGGNPASASICQSEDFEVTISAITNATATMTLSWEVYLDNVLVPALSQTNQMMEVGDILLSRTALVTSGVYEIKITSAVDLNGSAIPASELESDYVITVTVFELPEATITITENSGAEPNDGILCTGDNATLAVTGSSGLAPYSYVWSTTPPLTLTSIVVNTSGTRTVTITDDNGCTNTESATITVNPIVTPTFAPIGPLCQQSTAPSLPGTSTNGISGTWSPATISTATSGSTTYTFTPTAGQCAGTTTLSIEVTQLITPTFDPIDAVCQGTTPPVLPTTSGNGVSGTWSPATVSTASPGTTTYTFTPSEGCATGITLDITVNPLSGSFAISGKLIALNTSPDGVGAANVDLSGDDFNTTTTEADGLYSLAFNNAGDFDVTPSKSLPYVPSSDPAFPAFNAHRLNGVDVGDITRITQHLTGENPFIDPYLLVAADVNNSKTITSVDRALISAALKNIGAPPFSTSWRFVPASHQLAPLSQYPEFIAYTNICSSVTNQDFIGVKVGDVSEGYADAASFNTESDLTWNIRDQWLDANTYVDVDFSPGAFENIAAFQFALQFDPDVLEFVDYSYFDLLPMNEECFGTVNVVDGELRLIFAEALGYDTDGEVAAFRLRFKVLAGGQRLSDVMYINPTAMSAVAYTAALEQRGIRLSFAQVTGIEEDIAGKGTILYQNRPNPFDGQTEIRFRLPETSRATFTVHDVMGRIVFERSGLYAEGEHFINLDLPEAASGMLYYRLTTSAGQWVRKMENIKQD